MQKFVSDGLPTADQIRARLQKMDDGQLKRQDKAASFMCTPNANHGKPPSETFVIQLAECRAEWKHRRPAEPVSLSAE